MRRGRTLSKHLALETRQHDLLGADLGEGVPRRGLVFGLVVYGTWTLLMAPIIGIPSRWTLSLYMIPPGLFAYFAWQPSKLHAGRRRRATEWALGLRYAMTGHRPVIALGARPATRAECLPWIERLPIQPVIDFIVPTRSRTRSAWLVAEADLNDSREGTPEGPAIQVRQRALLVDSEHVAAARARTLRRLTKNTASARRTASSGERSEPETALWSAAAATTPGPEGGRG